MADAEERQAGSSSGPERQEARSRGWLPLLALDQLLFPRQQTYTAHELAAEAELDIDAAERLWRAMGFATVSRHEAVFLEDDLEALRRAVQALREGASLDEVVYQTRVMAAALSRAAEVSSDNIVSRVEQLRQAGTSEDEIAEVVSGADESDIDRLIGYFYRRQLRAILWRRLAEPDRSTEKATLTIGFVDLVRFTALTEDIAEDQLGKLIDRFETVAHERVTMGGGRIVKMIGDEVMFVTDGADQAVNIALDLVGDFGEDESVPPARAGLARGAVLARSGDYFGPVVNLAARIVDVARPSTVVASEIVRDTLEGRRDLSWRRLSPKRLKGIGRVAPWEVTARTPRSASHD